MHLPSTLFKEPSLETHEQGEQSFYYINIATARASFSHCKACVTCRLISLKGCPSCQCGRSSFR